MMSAVRSSPPNGLGAPVSAADPQVCHPPDMPPTKPTRSGSRSHPFRSRALQHKARKANVQRMGRSIAGCAFSSVSRDWSGKGALSHEAVYLFKQHAQIRKVFCRAGRFDGSAGAGWGYSSVFGQREPRTLSLFNRILPLLDRPSGGHLGDQDYTKCKIVQHFCCTIFWLVLRSRPMNGQGQTEFVGELVWNPAYVINVVIWIATLSAAATARFRQVLHCLARCSPGVAFRFRGAAPEPECGLASIKSRSRWS